MDLMGIKYDLDALNKVTPESVEGALQSKVSKFFESAKVTVLPIPNDATPIVIDKYFKREKPFSVEKKDEFRDAFVIEALKRLPDASNGIYIVSCDPDFVGADERFHIIQGVEELLSQYNAHTKVSNFVRRLVDKNMVSICKIIGKAIDKLDFVSYHGRMFDVGGLSSDIFEVTNTLVFNLQPRQATVRLELVVQFEGDALFLGDEYGVGDQFEGFNETLNLESTFTLRFNEELPDFFKVADVTVNNGNPITIELSSH